MRRALQIVLPLIFVVGAVGVVVAMVQIFAQDAAIESVSVPRAVEVVVADPQPHQAVVEATGTVQADRQVDLVAQVQGRVLSVADGLAPGLQVRKGAVLVRIDDRDYRNALAQAEANLAQAELNLALEESRAQQATREFDLLGESPDSPLARREPQLANARAAVASAAAAVDNARLNLERTRVTAPFDGIVLSESVDEGQLIGPTSPVARVIATDRFRVEVRIPLGDLRWLPLPDAKGEDGALAEIVQALPGQPPLTAQGRVTRLFGQLDPQTRTAGLLVVVEDPIRNSTGALPILPGAFVRVTLKGREIDDLVELPRVALREEGTVLVADAEDTLRRRAVSLAFDTRDHVYVSDGLAPGDRVITTPLSLPIEGMALDVQQPLAAN